MKKTRIFYIDLFCGAGGTTTGVHLANKNIKVAACVNHDAKAIESHKLNHPDCIHFTEDVRNMKVVAKISALVKKLRKKYPGCIINLWASLECINFSKAKGGLPRDADSRTLAHSLYHYVEALQPNYVLIENVREFMSWGPLDKNGRPINKLNGKDYIAWIKQMCSYGYHYDWAMLNSADFGAYTSRERYFGQFAKLDLPIKWPEATHAKKINSDGMLGDKLEPWKAVKEVLNLEEEGQSIFTRKKPLVEATLKRIYAGLIKFVAGGEKEFMVKNYSGHPQSKVHSLNRPAGTVTTIDHNSIVSVDKEFLTSYYGNGGTHDIKKPSPTLTTKDRITLVHPQFLTNYYSGGGQLASIESPNPTITGIPKQHLTSVSFIDQQYGNSKPIGIDNPVNTLTANPKFGLVKTNTWLMNPQFADKGRSLNRPCFTLIAKMDKRPPYLLVSKEGKNPITIDPYDTPMMKKIKEFMILYNIVDIKMRMLRVPELLKIQGFPEGYILRGTQADQKKFIGNAVVPVVAKAIANANATALIKG